MNSINLTGRIAQDLELKTTTSGLSVCTFTMAVDRPKVKDVTDFINCVAWRQSAEYLCRFGAKGSMIELTGTLQKRKYEDKNGNKRTAIEVVADSLKVNSPSKNESSNTTPTIANTEFEEVTDSELPF